MWGLPHPHSPLVTRRQGQREHRQRAELCTACVCGGNSLLGDRFSVIAQLYSKVRGTQRTGTEAGASPNLRLAAWSYHVGLTQHLMIIRAGRGKHLQETVVKITFKRSQAGLEIRLSS